MANCSCFCLFVGNLSILEMSMRCLSDMECLVKGKPLATAHMFEHIYIRRFGI